MQGHGRDVHLASKMKEDKQTVYTPRFRQETGKNEKPSCIQRTPKDFPLLPPSFHPIVCPQIAMDKPFLVLLLIWFRGHVHPPKQPFNVF
jgi:hypothetical protein